MSKQLIDFWIVNIGQEEAEKLCNENLMFLASVYVGELSNSQCLLFFITVFPPLFFFSDIGFAWQNSKTCKFGDFKTG